MARSGISETRIHTIADRMRRLEWRTGTSARELAAAWGLSLSSVEKLSAEASRRVRAEVCDPERVSTTVALALERVLHDALRDNDRRSVIQAAAVWARICPAKLAAPSTWEFPLRVCIPKQLPESDFEEDVSEYLRAEGAEE